LHNLAYQYYVKESRRRERAFCIIFAIVERDVLGGESLDGRHLLKLVGLGR